MPLMRSSYDTIAILGFQFVAMPTKQRHGGNLSISVPTDVPAKSPYPLDNPVSFDTAESFNSLPSIDHVLQIALTVHVLLASLTSC
jgi:hypothetical protein